MSDAHRNEIAKLEALYAEHPEGRIFTHLAEAYRKAGDLDRALEVLEEGIERHPDYSSAHVVRGRVLMDQGADGEARAEFERVLELDGQNLVAHRSLGDIARRAGRTEDALDHYETLLDLEPSDREVRELVEELTGGAEEPAEAEEPAPFDVGGSLEYGEPAPVEELEEETAGGEAFDESAFDEGALEEGVLEEGAIEADAAEEEAAVAEADAWNEEDWALAGDMDEEWSTEAPIEEEVEGIEADAGDEDVDDLAPLDLPGYESEAEGMESVGSSDEDADVMTETIAQVYARQGLYDRAAEVYEQLVRVRPDDEALKERLAEMQEKAAAAEAEESGAQEAAMEEPEAVEPVAGFESGEFEVGADEVAPMAGLESNELDPETGLAATEDEAEDAAPVVEDLTAFQAPDETEEPEWDATEDEDWDVEGLEEEEWDVSEEAEEWDVSEEADEWDVSAGAGGWDISEDAVEDEDEDEEVAGATEEPESDSDEVWSPEAEGWDTPSPESEAAESEVAEPEAAEAEPAEAPEGDLDEILAEAEAALETSLEPSEASDAPEEDEEPASPWMEGDWSGEAETDESPYAWAGAEEVETDASPPIRDYLSGLLDWTDMAVAPEEAGGTSDAADAPESGDAGDSDDDDLEMFRSWLESLKQ